MNTTTHKNKNGDVFVTAYGFACGYTQGKRYDTFDKTLFRAHNTYHVQSVKNNVPELHTKFDGNTSHLYTIWECFDKLSDARKFYNKIK